MTGETADVHPIGQDRDAELLARIRDGDEAAFGTVVEQEWESLLAYVSALVDDPDIAEDAVQEAFVRLWDRRRRWRFPGSARSILYRIARNLAFNERRHWRVRRQWAVRRRQDPPARSATPGQLLDARELTDAATRAIAALPERRREVFELIRFHNLTYRETADVMGISPQTVANQMTAALADLGRALAPWLEDSATAVSPGGHGRRRGRSGRT